ncbi:MAG: MauE/DoxX family redox-associated membrane protein [Ignavibacteria bacterium]
MKKLLYNRFSIFVLRLVIGGLFIYAAIGKIADPQGFANAIYRYEVLPAYFVNIPAIILPFIEFIAGLFLLLGIYKQGSSFLISGMLSFFIILLLSAYLRNLTIDCGCFYLENTSTKGDIITSIIRDLFMLAASLIIYRFNIMNKATITTNNLNS